MILIVSLLAAAVNGVFDFGSNMTMNANGTVMLIGSNMTMNANGTVMLIGANMTRNAMANDTEIVFDVNGTKWTDRDTKMLFVARFMSNDSILEQHANDTVSFVNG